MAIQYREVLLSRSQIAQAMAFISTRRLVFTERLLEILSDDEIALVCAHELGHLTESRSARYWRKLTLVRYLPWVFFNPVVHTFDFLGFNCLLLITLLLPFLFYKLSRKLESRADDMAKANEGDAGTYARALKRLYEDSLIPAVLASSRRTHPNLYDRMLSAGVTPDFPRPRPAANMAWHGHIIAGLVGLLFAFFAIRLITLSSSQAFTILGGGK